MLIFGHLVCRRMHQTNSVRGLSGIQVKSKCEVNQTSGFQDIAFTNNYCGRTDRQTDERTDRRTDGQDHSLLYPVFRRAYKKRAFFCQVCLVIFFLL